MLEVEMKTTIKTLHLKGYNKTQIGQMLNIDRKTVRKVLRSEEGCKEDKQTGRGVWPSVLDKHMEYISTQIAKGISITRIHQGLSTDYGVSCAYTTVRDYVSKIRKTQPEAYMVLFSLCFFSPCFSTYFLKFDSLPISSCFLRKYWYTLDMKTPSTLIFSDISSLYLSSLDAFFLVFAFP